MSAPLKIVHLILTSRFAGSERYAIDLANAQSNTHEVIVLLTNSAAQDRVDALAHRLVPPVRIVLLDAWKPFLAGQARREVRRLAPDVAHAHLSIACRALQGLSTTSLRVATLHICYKPQQHDQLDALIAIAPWQMQHVPPSLRERSVQIDNWSTPLTPSTDARTAIRRQFGIAEDSFVIGALGRAERSKGFDILLQAVDQAALPGSRLCIVGDGRDWRALRHSAPPAVIMPGFAAAPQDWYAAFDLFVSPARSEPFGLVFLEAMHAGLPIVASATQGALQLRDMIDRPLLPIGDVDALARELREVHAQRPHRRRYDLRRFDRDRQVSLIESFYRTARGARA